MRRGIRIRSVMNPRRAARRARLAGYGYRVERGQEAIEEVMTQMRKPAAVGVVGSLLGASAAAAMAASLTPTTAAFPSSAPLTAGSSRHPQGLRLTVDLGWHSGSAANQPILTRLDIWFPRGSRYNGARYPICSVQTLDRSGPAGCPKGSIMGRGTGTAYADTTITRPSITVVNGGANALYFYTVLNNPARVQEPVIGHIARVHGNFTYHLSATIPQNLQVVAGVPIELTNLYITAGRGTWLATTNAPAGIQIVSTFNTGATTSELVWVGDT
jgi:hypothetical protein